MLECLIKVKTTDMIYGSATVPDNLTAFILSH